MPLEGTLQDFSLADVIQLISLGKKTGAVQIDVAGANREASGRIYFRAGRIVSASAGSMRPDEAVYNFFTLRDASFKFMEGVNPLEENLSISNEMLIMEGIRRVEEWNKISHTLPSMDTILTLVSDPAATAPDISLKPDEWRVLTLINGQESISSIAQRSGFGEIKTSQIVFNLIQNGLIEKVEAKPLPVGRPIYQTLYEVAGSQLGRRAEVLLEDAYRRIGLVPQSNLTFDQAQAVCANFETSLKLLLGPSKAKQLADQMRNRVKQVYSS